MATYAELRGIFGEDVYQKKIEAALVDAAQAALLEADTTTLHAQRLKLAFKVIEDPVTWGRRFAAAILFKNKSATLSAIQGASDSAALTEVNAFYDEFSLHYST